MDIPKFSQEIADMWSDRVMIDDKWIKNSDQPADPGEAGGFFVHLEKNPEVSAYLKPTKKDERCRAAYEKIISDIAHKIGVTVPPVVLFDRQDVERGEEPYTCVSLVIFPVNVDGKVLEEIEAFQLAYVKDALLKSTGIIALDTYVANTDRVQMRNMIFGSEKTAEDGRFVYLDFCNSMNYQMQWENRRYNNVRIPDMPLQLREAANLSIIEDTISKIEALEDTFIDNVVNRIPERYIDEKDRKVVLEGLLERRSKIRKVLKDNLFSGKEPK